MSERPPEIPLGSGVLIPWEAAYGWAARAAMRALLEIAGLDPADEDLDEQVLDLVEDAEAWPPEVDE
ncbi:MAG: hypothetical protein U0167_15430 [bacterium]